MYSKYKMPCPICKHEVDQADHRVCVYSLFKINAIQTVYQWEAMARKPVTIVKGRVRIRVAN